VSLTAGREGYIRIEATMAEPGDPEPVDDPETSDVTWGAGVDQRVLIARAGGLRPPLKDLVVKSTNAHAFTPRRARSA
jgi:hypothetical protein